jgi:hypothetical protein
MLAWMGIAYDVWPLRLRPGRRMDLRRSFLLCPCKKGVIAMTRRNPTVRWSWLGAALAAAAGAALAAPPPAAEDAGAELAKPVQILAGGQPIDVEIGHAAPFFADFNGDGKSDLLVGQFGDGKLRIYTNAGTREQPKFGGQFTWFQADRQEGKVPAS